MILNTGSINFAFCSGHQPVLLKSLHIPPQVPRIHCSCWCVHVCFICMCLKSCFNFVLNVVTFWMIPERGCLFKKLVPSHYIILYFILYFCYLITLKSNLGITFFKDFILFIFRERRREGERERNIDV